MGQKTNPNIIRLGKNKTWNSQYFEKKPTETAIYTFKILEIKNFINKFFKDHGLNIHDCKIYYLNENSLNICISYYLTFNSVNIISYINKNQNIKFIQKTHTANNNKDTDNNQKLKNEQPSKLISTINKTKLKKNVYLNIKQKVKNYTNYQIIRILNNIKTQESLLKKSIKIEKKYGNIRRLNFLKIYKKFLLLKINKNFKTIETNKILTKFFESLQLFINKKTNIYMTFQQLNKNVKHLFNIEKIEKLKKKLVIFKKYEQNSFFKEGINTLFTCTTQKNSARLLAQFIALQLQKLKRHNFFLRFIKTALLIFCSDKNLSQIKGLKIKIKGRINGAPRAKHKIINIGKGVPNLTLEANINYADKTSYTSNGTFGVKVWTYEK